MIARASQFAPPREEHRVQIFPRAKQQARVMVPKRAVQMVARAPVVRVRIFFQMVLKQMILVVFVAQN